PEAARVLASLDQDADASGVFTVAGQPFQAISAPILSPTLSGWVVFANRLDKTEMASLERYSAIPIKASVVYRTAAHAWRFAGGDRAGVEPGRLSRFVEGQLSDHGVRAKSLATDGGASIALVTPLKTLSTGPPAALVLRYPM